MYLAFVMKVIVVLVCLVAVAYSFSGGSLGWKSTSIARSININRLQTRSLKMSVFRDPTVSIDVLPMRFRKATKQLATLGPASNTFEMIEKLFLSGADIFRLNFSHGEHGEKAKLVEIIRAVEKKYDHPIAILGDLQGPKLRVGTFENDEKVILQAGQEFTFDLDTELSGTNERVGMPHPEILNTLKADDTLLLDDGKLRMRVLRTSMDGTSDSKGSVTCMVVVGGALSNRKGVNTPSIVLPISPLTQKDRKDLEFILTLDIDWCALSFVQTPEDVKEFRELAGSKVKIMSKLEKPCAIEPDNLEKICQLSDGIMVARGDLGVEMNPWDVPVIQKQIVSTCKRLGRPVVIATQMMESMIESPTPTRAEASDCATAIFESADAVMLSAESAAGMWPVESVTMQQLIINKVEADPLFQESLDQYAKSDSPAVDSQDPTGAITLAAREVANVSKSKALLCFTRSGGTVMRCARLRPRVPIIAACYSIEVARQLALVWGVYPVLMEKPDVDSFSIQEESAKFCALACKKGFADPKTDLFTITAGLPFGTVGVSNYLRVLSAAGPRSWFSEENPGQMEKYDETKAMF